MATVGGPAQAQHTAGDHVCWVVDGEETKRGAVVAFLRDGLERGERLIYVAPRPLDDLLGLGDVDRMLADGRLRVESLTDLFAGLGTGRHVDPVTQVDRLRELTHEALVDGYAGLRLATDGTPLVTDVAQRRAFMTYEVLADRYIAAAPLSALCTYDDRVLGLGASELASVHRHRHTTRPVSDPRFGVHLSGPRVFVVGEVDLANHQRFATALGAIADCDDDDHVLDLTDLTFIDSRGVGELRHFVTHTASRRFAIEDPRGFVRTIATALSWDDLLAALV
jgi:hypothetical protein